MKLKNVIYTVFILLAVCLIINSVVGVFSAQKTSTYTDKYLSFSYPANWQVIGSNAPGMVMLNDSGNTRIVMAKEQLGDGNNSFEEIESNVEESYSYAGNHTVSGTNLSYEVYSDLGTLISFYLIKKGDEFFAISGPSGLDESNVELIFKTIQ